MTPVEYWIEVDGRRIDLGDDRANALTTFRAVVNVSHSNVSLCKSTHISSRYCILTHTVKSMPRHMSLRSAWLWVGMLSPRIYDPLDRKYLEYIRACFDSPFFRMGEAA